MQNLNAFFDWQNLSIIQPLGQGKVFNFFKSSMLSQFIFKYLFFELLDHVESSADCLTAIQAKYSILDGQVVPAKYEIQILHFPE